jgi:ABC-type uncharacterized transport system involved in gliding motility auxiliary subunit
MKSGKNISAVVLLVAALVLVNYLASSARIRFDLTADRTYTLSDGTRRLLDKIEEPITLQLYYTRSLRDNPRITFIKNYATRVEELLRQYAASSKGKIKLVVTDPRPDTPEEEAAARSRVTGQPLGDGTKLFLGLVATQADQQKTIEFFAPNREPFLEYDISKLIHSVQLINKPKLGLLSSIPLKGSQYSMPGMPRQQGQVVAEEWGQNFEIVEVQPSASELPAGLDALAVIHPQSLSDQMQFCIDQFVLSGKPLFLALDPSSRHFAEQKRQMQMYGAQPNNSSSDLPRLLSAWGVGYDSKKVAGDLDLAYIAQTQNGTSSMPAWIGLQATNISKDFIPGNGIKEMLFLEAGAFTLNPPSGLEAIPIVETGTRRGTIDTMMMQMSQTADLSRQVRPDGKKRVLAAMLRGSFKTAFPDGPPKTPEPPKGEGNAAQPKPESQQSTAIKESKQPGSVFIVGDSDWLLDEASLDTRYRSAGIVMPFNDNLAFATNVVDYLGGSRDLISLRGKGSSQRPFEVIRRMELDAQAAYQDRLDELEGRLQAVQQRLSELLQKQKDQTRLIATAEMQAETEKFRAEEATMRSERRAIRQTLREGIERLQNTIIGFNMIVVPGLVVIGGLWFFQRRTKRQRA